jgi:hypothetical protein
VRKIGEAREICKRLKLEEDSVGEGLREGNGIDRELIEL